MPARRSTSPRPRPTSWSCRRPTPSSPAWPRPRPVDRPTCRPCASPTCSKLGHPMSVDLYVEQVVARARLVILRLLGGRSYWPYGLEQVTAACRAAASARAVARRRPAGPRAARLEHAAPEVCHRLWQYLVHGGLDNAGQLLAYAAGLLGRDDAWREPAPLLRAGLYWPGLRNPDLAMCGRAGAWPTGRRPGILPGPGPGGRPRGRRRADRGAGEAGLNALPVFAASLKDPFAASLVREWFGQAEPAVVLNATGFAVSSPGAWRPTPLDQPDRPVLQVVLSGGSEEGWRAGTRGLSARDLAMNVALPEVDGRVLGRAVAFKARKRFDPATEINIVGFAPADDRVRFTAELAAAWARLGATPRPAAGRDRARQLSQSRRPDREWRRPGHAGEHGAPARGVARRRLSDREVARERPGPGRGPSRRRHQRPRDTSRADHPSPAFGSDYLTFFRPTICQRATKRRRALG